MQRAMIAAALAFLSIAAASAQKWPEKTVRIVTPFGPGGGTDIFARILAQRLTEVLGQDHLLAPDKPIGRMVAARRIASMILWGPPGSGKTTIARLLAETTDLEFEARRIVGLLATTWAGTLLARHGDPEVFQAYAASRLANDHGVLFGTLPPGTPADAIVERAIPAV